MTLQQESTAEAPSAGNDLTLLRSKDRVSIRVEHVRDDGGIDGFDLWLRRYKPDGSARGTVLLIHGASASSDSFLVPDGGLVHFLRSKGWDVWTLDWRGSCQVVDALPEEPLGGSIAKECDLFTLDQVAKVDFPRALDVIQQTLQEEARKRGGSDTAPSGGHPISVVAHCFGSGAFSIALARGHVEERGVKNVVLVTLGLFYETPWDGWIKVEDFLIERVLGHQPKYRAIDPRKYCRWPDDMKEAYQAWPPAWLPAGTLSGDMIFKHLAFMFGQPYLRDRLAPSIHGPLLQKLFGGMHLGLYLHAGQMVRRGYAARMNVLDLIDRSRLHARTSRAARARGDLDPTHFGDKEITLITGAQNRLWHRDSVDLMYEWLRSNRPSSARAKHVLENYAHQDLLWGAKAISEVYDLVSAGIQERP